LDEGLELVLAGLGFGGRVEEVDGENLWRASERSAARRERAGGRGSERQNKGQ
jgi:hypothetical protein